MAIDNPSLTTLQSRRGRPKNGGAAAPALTIAYHPDPARVGERALLAGTKVVEVSRAGPEFFAVASSEGKPLAIRHLSRRPVAVTLGEELVCVNCSGTSTTVEVDGAAVDGEVSFARDRLAGGVAIVLGGRVVLVLHESTRVTVEAPTDGMVGVSDAIATLRDEIRNVAGEDVPVLLLGESGTGKELAARALHRNSGRRDGPFVSINMAAIPSSTATSELFGHEAGAFTGATNKHDGYFVQATGGTLFLDEIGAASLEIQAMLLRALETRQIRPIGARADREVDVRVVAATDLDLDSAAKDGRFRLPLLHRLAVYPIDLVPLRHRRQDIGPLMFHFLQSALGDDAARLLNTGEDRPWLGAAVAGRLLRHPWPGNVRQLANAIRQVAIANRGTEVVTLTPALERVLGGPEEPREPSGVEPEPSSARPKKRPDLDDLSDAQVLSALRNNRFKVAATARELGISKNSLYQLMERSDSIRRAKDLTIAEVREAHAACDGDVSRMAMRLQVSTRGLKLRMTDLGIDDWRES